MSQKANKPSFGKQDSNTSTGNAEFQVADPSILQELKEICLNAAERYVALRVPALTPRLLSHLVEFVTAKGLELVEHWGEDDIDPLSGDEWESDEESSQ